ncbi:MAG: site-specific integrase [Bacteroidota bacterium]
MARATYSVLYFINRTKLNKDGKAMISARITLNNQKTEFATSRTVDPEEWSQEAEKVKGNTKEVKEINSYLTLIRSNLLLKKRELEEHGQELTALNLKNVYMGLDAGSKTILGIFREHNEKCKKLMNIDFAPGTVERYEVCYKHISDFIKIKYRKTDVKLYEVTPMFISDFELYLKTTRKCAHNTATKYIKNFKKIIRIALANGWLKKDPFANIKFHLDAVDLAYLDAKELDKLMKKQFPIERMQQVKDVYLFCCFTGLAFVDVTSLTNKDIVDNEGSKWIKKRRRKTKNWCHIPLLEPALRILEKYEGNPQCISKGKLLPVLSNQKMNAYLQEIADILGIDKHLSTHTARHTFATTVTLANQVSMEVVSKMLGHSSVNMTKKYARVVDDLIKKDMQKIAGKYDAIMAN